MMAFNALILKTLIVKNSTSFFDMTSISTLEQQ